VLAAGHPAILRAGRHAVLIDEQVMQRPPIGPAASIRNPVLAAHQQARPYRYHMPMARTQTLVQLSDELLERLDSYRAREGRSRSDVVREAIERYLAADLEAEIDRRIVEAYTRQPPEDMWNDRAARQMISAEPW
jgi:predicted DNA-binding protein